MSPRPGHTRATPFPVDAAAAARIASLVAAVGEEFTAAVLAGAAERADASFVPSPVVASLVAAFGLASEREAALLALPAAATFARPHISDYHVGAVGVTTGGDLVLGGNLEFPGASIHHTVHGEGFVTLRSRALGLPLAELAIRQARPCAHCRQVLAEMAWAGDVRLVDPLGSDVSLWDVYPAAFEPGDLDEAGCDPGAVSWPELALADREDVSADVREALEAAGARAHAPYSREPAALVLRTADGTRFPGSVLENVAFNPTIGPGQDALVAVAAAGVPYDAVTDAWLGVVRGGRVNHEAPLRDLLGVAAPGAAVHVRYWR